MTYCEKLMRHIWKNLEKEEQENILRQIGKQNDMVFKSMETFSRWGLETTTAVYTYQDSEFVFVPGDTVTLGWNGFVNGMTQATKTLWQEELEDFDIEDNVETYLQSITSDIRQATIAPMLVERTIMEIGWEIVSEYDVRVQTEFAEKLKIAKKASCNQRQWNVGDMRFRAKKTEQGVELALYHNMSKEQVCAQIAKEGRFRLPTMDQWEYLAGGGIRTLFPWGDDMACYMVEERDKDDDEILWYRIDTKGDLESPNFFGIIIGNDSYQMELIADGLGAKGGDGGCSCCGGFPMMEYLVCSPYYYDEQMMEDLIDETHCNGDFEFVRRVKTVTWNEN